MSSIIPSLELHTLTANQLQLQETDPETKRKELQTKTFTAWKRESNGVLHFLDEEEVTRQRGVVWEMIKMVGSSLLEGRDLTTLTLPIQLFEPKSFLEKITEGWAYAPTFLTKAALTTDPIERFKLVITFVVAGMHLTPSFRKPFNPILGETYEASFFDGTKIFCEQTGHHPPVSAWQVVGPNSSYHYWGYGVCSASGRGNTIKGYQTGPSVIEFADGTRISFTLPVLNIKGVLWGERGMEFSGALNFKDEKNHLACDLNFNPEAHGLIKSLFSKSKGGADYVKGDLYHSNEKDKKKNIVCSVDGSWLSSLDFGKERYWDADTMAPHLIHPCENPLPSDSRIREDLVALAEEDIERGKECKLMLEERQRYDARLRSRSKASTTPSTKSTDKSTTSGKKTKSDKKNKHHVDNIVAV